MVDENSPNTNKCLKIGAWGATISALCCLTPILAVGLSMVGLGMLTGYLDYLLLPALGIFLLLAVYGLYQRKRRG